MLDGRRRPASIIAADATGFLELNVANEESKRLCVLEKTLGVRGRRE